MRIYESLSKVVIFALFVACFAGGCAHLSGDGELGLVGAWRGKVRFTSGAFAETKDLEFMYVFNQGGTMTESSNYDASPPVPPAYGIWRKVGNKEYEAKYEFYVTKPPTSFDEIVKGGGWGPAGRGIFVERITLSADGKSFTSKIKYDQFDTAGKTAEGGGQAEGTGVR